MSDPPAGVDDGRLDEQAKPLTSAEGDDGGHDLETPEPWGVEPEFDEPRVWSDKKDKFKIAKWVLGGIFVLLFIALLAAIFSDGKDVLDQTFKFLVPMATVIIGYYFGRGE